MDQQKQTIKAIFLAKTLATTAEQSLLHYRQRLKQAANNFLHLYKDKIKDIAEISEQNGNPTGAILDEMANEVANMDITRLVHGLAVLKMVNEGKFDKQNEQDGADESADVTEE
jgi:hypothetical protein